MWQEAVVALLEELYWYFGGGAEKTMKNLSKSWYTVERRSWHFPNMSPAFRITSVIKHVLSSLNTSGRQFTVSFKHNSKATTNF
jgi:hypothetical protein